MSFKDNRRLSFLNIFASLEKNILDINSQWSTFLLYS